jgi:phytoene/squalene synthetase
MLPYWIRRPFLIARDLLASRERPDLDALGRIEDPEAFIWAILPHAARTFSACIALLPARSALAAAVGYLYCRMLDTYEDLVPEHSDREASLRRFADRLTTTGDRIEPAPVIEKAADRDDRDRSHLLLVKRSALVDRVFLSFDSETRAVVRDLVCDMAEGMRWSSTTFQANGGVLVGEEQLAQYCRHVLGNPVVFSVRLLRMHYGKDSRLTPEEHEASMLVGEMVQLANVTRDVEKDLRRGIAYDTTLKNDLGKTVSSADGSLIERCRQVRERLLRMALRRAAAYRDVIDAIRLPRVSVARASAVLMLLFTERYFRSCARRAGLQPWNGPNTTMSLITRSIPATFSVSRANREFDRVETEFLALAR